MTSTELFEIPEHLLVHKQDNIYTTTAHQFADFNDAYKRFPLPNDILFPWLHGVDGFSNQQNLFFGVRRSLAPNYRGLMVLHCQEDENTSRLIETVLPQQVLLMDQREFINSYNQEFQINLRNFKNQVSRFATICDIVLYGKHAQQVAKALSEAQQKLHKERVAHIEYVEKSAGKRATVNANKITYKAIVIEGEKSHRWVERVLMGYIDDFSIFEKDHPELVMCDSTGLAIQKRDFFQLENMQMREMSKATEVTQHVWVSQHSNLCSYYCINALIDWKHPRCTRIHL
jgi:dual specificity MAP kinase phosphatase